MHLTRTTFFSAAAIVACAGFAGSASANHIDFIQDDSDPGDGVTDATFSLETDDGPIMGMQMGEEDDILGGIREVTLDTGGFSGEISAERSDGSDVISVENDALTAGSMSLSYPGFQDLDFASSWNFIAVSVPELDNEIGDGLIDIGVTVESSAGSGTLTRTGIDGSGTFFFAFSDDEYASVDFTDVDGVTVDFDTEIEGTDFNVGSITREAVPAPGAAALLALAGMRGVRRRRASLLS